MEILEWLRLIAGGALLLSGLIIFLIELYGVFHLKYVLNRMHAAAMGDTLGISFSLVGLMIFSGLNFTTLKMMLIVIFLWLASPVSSHLLARLEVVTNEKLENHCQSYSDLAVLEEELKKEREKETGGEEV
ncbi:MAG: monovalent cation/H(+) antiporter subunit G [Lachnospiraceae bacterium]|jgi:multicomponent Na+:H+ antiporter subunit G|nr:monovalent cation/H(+) antiporter subunit G [Lachnospiraceae bacterium]MCI9202529.1 monovalent cation/H(+) antiporter subunit G [Lachnospiraceae bacterium]